MHPILKALSRSAEEADPGEPCRVRGRSASGAGLRTAAFAQTIGVDVDRVLLRTAELLFLRLADLDEAVFAERGADGATSRATRRLTPGLGFADFHLQDGSDPGGDDDAFGLPAVSAGLPNASASDEDVPLHLALAKDGDEIAWSLFYRPEVLNGVLAQHLFDLFEALLQNGLANPSATALDLPYLPQAERERVLASARGPERDHGRTPVCERLLPASPDAIAVVDGSIATTRLELDRRAGAIALALHGAELAPRSRVGVHIERSAEWVAAMVGVMRADMVYVPLSTSAPPERLAHIVADAGVRLVVGDPSSPAADAIRRAGATILAPDALIGAVDRDPYPTLGPVDPDSDAYVLYTSGSTGVPKGVRVSHASLAHYVEAAATAFGEGIESPTFLQFADAAFDVSLLEVFYPLCHGGRTVIHRSSEAIVLKDFARTLEDHRVDMISPPTAFWNVWSEEILAGRARVPDGVRSIVVGGEIALPRRFAGGFGRARLFNAYGPTEATVDSTVHPCDDVRPRDRYVPIGRPLANVRAYVLDRKLSPVAFGVAGEIVIGGAGVAQGYVGHPDVDAARFVEASRLPFAETGRLYRTGDIGYRRADGALVCLGREDAQVKMSGIRIDLSEIERALQALDLIEEAAAVLRAAPGTEPELLLFVRPRDPAPDEDETRARIAAELAPRIPAAAIPRVRLHHGSFPLNLSGKIDRAALARGLEADEPAEHRDLDGPGDPFERFVWQVWHRLMANQPLASVSEDLFGREVSSLRLGLFFAELADTLDVEIDLEDFGADRSVAGIAARLKAVVGPDALPDEVSP